MTKKIKGSLFVKVFLITTVMLLCISLLVFGMLAWLMPQTYSNKLDTILDERTQNFISELEQVGRKFLLAPPVPAASRQQDKKRCQRQQPYFATYFSLP